MAERKKPEPIRIIFNGQEEYSTEVDALYKVTGKLMVKFAPKFEYMSLEAIKEMLVVVMDMIQEASVLFKKGGVHTSRHLKSLATQIKHCKTKDELIIYIYNQFLLAEGLNTLPGFGFVKMEKNEEGRRTIKGNFHIDPEKTSIYTEM